MHSTPPAQVVTARMCAEVARSRVAPGLAPACPSAAVPVTVSAAPRTSSARCRDRAVPRTPSRALAASTTSPASRHAQRAP